LSSAARNTFDFKAYFEIPVRIDNLISDNRIPALIARQNVDHLRVLDVQSESESGISTHKRDKETLTVPQRFGEIVSAFIILLIFAFYLYHQVENTGFFTSKFGNWEMFAFYGSLFLSLVPPLARAWLGRRNPVRPVEAFCNLFFALALLYLLLVFPFNFAHFADALPVAVRFMFGWLSNDIAKVAMVLGILGTGIAAAVNFVRYLFFNPN